MIQKRHGWLKLEVPALSKNKMDDNIQKYINSLKRNFERQNIQIISVQPTQIIEEEDCEPYYEVNCQLVSEQFSSALLGAMQEFCNSLSNFPYTHPNLVLHSSNFWQTNLKSHHNNVSLNSIYFGNIQGGTFFNHWEISFWNETNEHSRINSLLHKISAEFEFDKNDMMTIFFQCLETDKMNRGAKMKVSYQVIIRRQQIRRIIVDPSVQDDYTKSVNRFRVHFDLHCPAMIRRALPAKEQTNNNFAIPLFKRYRSFTCASKNNGYPTTEAVVDSPIFTIEFKEEMGHEEIYLILSRLRHRTGASIEFGRIPSIDVPIGKRYPYHRWTIREGQRTIKLATAEDAPIFREFLEELFWIKSPNGKYMWAEERKFAITYLIESLISRGAVVKDQILLDDRHWIDFLHVIAHYYRIDDKICEAALEDLIHLIDGRKRVGSITKCLDEIGQKRHRLKLANGLSEEELKEGYLRIRKLVFTPTRVIMIPPETIMGNRVLRKFDVDGTRIIRVTFRDDSNSRLRASVGKEIIDWAADNRLKYGVRVANKDYGFLGCSNSQMRDNGAYFALRYTDYQLHQHKKNAPDDDLKTYAKLIPEMLKYLGKFEKSENLPKMMARLGQCFTQSRLSGVNLPYKKYINTYDLEGGKNLLGKQYTFSDGVGIISYKFAETVARCMNFGNSVPSCFQYRFRGMKGVIALEPLLDKTSQWAIENGHEMEESHEKNVFDLACIFRPSQIKFNASRKNAHLEIVKFSSPVPVALNKPFISILDQVSEMQSLKCHKRITGRIEELMERQISLFAKQMNDELYCRNKLKEFPRRIDIDFMKPVFGFNLANEPFFRSLIKASIKFSITKQIRKEQIPIPQELGRSMLGVVDETGRLQYGQIFVQYTKNLALKLPTKNAARQVLTGTVLLTKNPCIVAGDVRIFEAVDIPELHHMCDVVVFPQHGPRPHPDEMAGSDLDGDEYSVIWDPELLLERNEVPFDFAVPKHVEPFDIDNAHNLMREFYVKYLELDSVGVISNSHLHSADQYGLNSEVCMNLAKKNSQAVDFTKSGQAPEKLVTKWTQDPVTLEWMPPELPERVPDYHINNERNPMYVSPRLCGKLFREFKAIDDVIKISEERDEQLEVTIDETIFVPGYEQKMKEARADLASYNSQLRTIMENYGIKTEGELFSGCILEMRNRISDKDQDDMSFFNTNQMIETKVTNLFCRFREHFFEEFGSVRAVLELMINAYDGGNVLNYQCTQLPSIAMAQKAVAWYRACYEEAQITKETRKLSFAWIVYDVIAKIKEKNVLNSEKLVELDANPMFSMMQIHREQYIMDNLPQFEAFNTFGMFDEDCDEAVQKAVNILKMYIEKHPGLEAVLFVIIEWAKSSELFDKTTMRIHHLALIFIMFATRPLPTVSSTTTCFLGKIRIGNENELTSNDNFERHAPFTEVQRSNMIVKFFEYLSSRQFRSQSHISFTPIGYESVFMRGEWHIFHTTALKTYYNILFNLRFEELPVSTDPETTIKDLIREDEPFVIELPSDDCNPTFIEQCMKDHTGISEVEIRRLDKSDQKKKESDEEKQPSFRYLVSCRGSLESIQRLRKLVAVTIPIRSHLVGKEVTRQMARLCYARIIQGIL